MPINLTIKIKCIGDINIYGRIKCPSQQKFDIHPWTKVFFEEAVGTTSYTKGPGRNLGHPCIGKLAARLWSWMWTLQWFMNELQLLLNTAQEPLENSDTDNCPQMRAFVEVQVSRGKVPADHLRKKENEFGCFGDSKRNRLTLHASHLLQEDTA